MAANQLVNLSALVGVRVPKPSWRQKLPVRSPRRASDCCTMCPLLACLRACKLHVPVNLETESL